MLNRGLGILCGLGMVVANAAIIWRDILPHWLASEAPPNEAMLLAPGERRQVQIGIYDDAGRSVGTSWTISTRTAIGDLVTVKTTTVLEPILLPAVGDLATPRVRIETELTYRYGEAAIDELDFKMFGLGVPIALHGEAMPSGEFPFAWQVGEHRGKAVLDSRIPAALGDVIRPFDRLPDLYVGRTWRLDLLDPLAQLLPQFSSDRRGGLGLEPVLARVTRTETILDGGNAIEAFVVEGAGATAWVAPDGRVLRQEVSVPLLGRLVLLEEPFSDFARRRAVFSTFGRRPPLAASDQPQEPSDE